ncbi:MAG: hypothetical protein GY851_32375 [bacterium]|nr:hypothetical protein [bacterium]
MFITPGTGLQSAPAPKPSRDAGATGLQMQMRDMTHHIQRLQLLNQALWELVRDKLNLTDADFERMAQEIDLRDGVADGRMTETPMKCPQCGRTSNSKHWRCLYCGLEFKKPVMG